jgi:REP element-mobilizing transposase RayT
MTAEREPAEENQPRPHRLRRLDRVFPQAPVYFVTASTAKRQNLLATDAMHDVFVRFATTGRERGAWVGRYVLMPDHLHLFVAFDDERISLALWMKSLKNALSKILRAAGVESPHWQKGFFDHVLRSGESCSDKWNYVRENPVRAGLVARSEDWPYQGEIHPLEVRRS